MSSNTGREELEAHQSSDSDSDAESESIEERETDGDDSSDHPDSPLQVDTSHCNISPMFSCQLDIIVYHILCFSLSNFLRVDQDGKGRRQRAVKFLPCHTCRAKQGKTAPYCD